jgi:hypothetical protein
MVLEPAQLSDAGQVAVRDDVADGPAAPRSGGDVEQPGAGMVAAGAVRHGVAQDLQAGADRQGHAAALHGPAQRPVAAQPARGEQLGGVLAATEQVDVAPGGRVLPGGAAQHLGRDAAPAQALRQHGGVAGVRVGAEYVGQQQPDQD